MQHSHTGGFSKANVPKKLLEKSWMELFICLSSKQAEEGGFKKYVRLL